MANRKRSYRPTNLIDIQNYCCCSCQNFEEVEEEDPNEISQEDLENSDHEFCYPYYLYENAPQEFSCGYNYDGGGSYKKLQEKSYKKSRPSRNRHPTKKCWPRKFLSNTWLFFMISLLINIWPVVHSHSSGNFSPEDRRLLRGLFLRKFGLEQLVSETQPNDMPIPEYLWEMYKKVDEEGPEIVRHYYPISASKDTHLDMNGWSLIYNLSATNREIGREALINADLRIKLDEALHEDCGVRKINVYAILGVQPRVFRLLDSQELKSSLLTRNSQWIDLDVSDALLTSRPNDDMVELFIEYASSESKSSPVQLSEPQYSAALVTYFEYEDEEPTGENSRQKRSPRQGRKHHKRRRQHHRTPEAKNQCRRTPLYVDFSELNWRDWIVAPNGYEAYQCQGNCPHPLPSNLNTTNHAIIQSLIHSLDPSIVPPPSCVPTEMSSVTILYRDINNAIMMKVYPDMVVDACGCR